MRDPTFLRATALLTTALVALPLLVPVLPGHDLPQHLAYARILGSPTAEPMATLYDVDLSNPYCTVHRALAWASHLMPLDLAVRLLYAAYALTVIVSFAWLGRELHGRRWEHVALLGTAIVWSPIACMGFLPFMVTVPLFVMGVAASVRWHRTGGLVATCGVAGATILLGAIHVVALSFFLLFVALQWLVSRPLRVWRLAPTAAGLLVFVSSHPATAAGARGFKGFWWSSLGEKSNMILATVFGPFPHRVRFGVELGALLLAGVVAYHRRRRLHRLEHERAFLRAALAFGAVACFVPNSVREPDDLSYIEFRMFVFAFALLIAAVPASWFATRLASRALVVGITLFVGCWVRQVAGAGGELRDAVELVSRLEPSDRLLVLSFHDRSAFFDESNGMNHYAGVYHAVRTGGAASLFWGKVARHLPVGFRPNAGVPHPPDWRPGEFTRAQVAGATHVLVSWPDASDGPLARSGAARFRQTMLGDLRQVACRSMYCLYASRL